MVMINNCNDLCNNLNNVKAYICIYTYILKNIVFIVKVSLVYKIIRVFLSILTALKKRYIYFNLYVF